MNINEIIDILKLEPLPLEGGLYRQTYIKMEAGNENPLSTAIYYLLDKKSFSHMHQLPSDEMYHFYLGDSVEILELYPDGSFKTTRLGDNIDKGEKLQYVVPAGVWQGTKLVHGGSYALLGTTMTPGYTDAGYIHGKRDFLIQQYPEAKELIAARTSQI